MTDLEQRTHDLTVAYLASKKADTANEFAQDYEQAYYSIYEILKEKFSDPN